MQSDQKKAKVRQLIKQAIETNEGADVKLPKGPDQLTIAEINDAAWTAAMWLNLGGGSVGTIDLYRLLQAYLLDEAKQKEINEIVFRDGL